MLICEKMNQVDFINTPLYQIYLKGKTSITWDEGLDWTLAKKDSVLIEQRELAIDVASMSAHVEILGMQNAAELLSKCSDFSLKIALGQAVNDEARHAELFAKYAILAGGKIRDHSKTQQIYDQHFSGLVTFDEIFLSHVFLESGALEQFNVFIKTFGENSLIGQIYKGALQDEARHVQMGIQYFKYKISQDSRYGDFVRTHLNDYKAILQMNDAAIDWYAGLSGISKIEINQRVIDRHDSFIKRIL